MIKIVSMEGAPGARAILLIDGTLMAYAAEHTTDSGGVWVGSVPNAATIITVTPSGSDALIYNYVLGTEDSGGAGFRTVTVTFTRLKPSGLGITLGTLLTVTIYDTPVPVTFSITATIPV